MGQEDGVAKKKEFWNKIDDLAKDDTSSFQNDPNLNVDQNPGKHRDEDDSRHMQKRDGSVSEDDQLEQ